MFTKIQSSNLFFSLGLAFYEDFLRLMFLDMQELALILVTINTAAWKQHNYFRVLRPQTFITQMLFSVYVKNQEGSEQLVRKVAKMQERCLGLLFKGSQLLNRRSQNIHVAFIASTWITHNESQRNANDTLEITSCQQYFDSIISI